MQYDCRDNLQENNTWKRGFLSTVPVQYELTDMWITV
jgi:hypothetical protein